jgi:hypothetical protein
MSKSEPKGSDWDPLDGIRDRSNKMCNDLWKYMDKLDEHINTLPQGQSRQYLEQYKSLAGMIAELYAFSAASVSKIRSTEQIVIKVLFKEVFGDRTITLPYEPKKEETLAETARRLKEKEPKLDWMIKGLDDAAKDLEPTDKANSNYE